MESQDNGPMAEAATTIWALKPWWCQPWSILLTGLTLVLASWWWLQTVWITVSLALAVGLWWMLFLVLVPAAWRAEHTR